MRRTVFVRLSFLIVVAFVLGTATAQAQSAIAGVVRDATGAVLPGVTVEASSPALIEKVRSVISDDQGQYRVVDLRPGIYTVTFSLPGFSTVRREGVELEANFTANVNADLRVGALEETITVSGATPVVDIQTTQRREVLTRELLDALPAARTFSTNTVPAIVRGPDVGGSGSMQHATMNVYGSTDGQDILVDGMSVMTAARNPGVYYNYAAQEETVYQVGGGSAEATAGGVVVNMIPRQGGNEVKGDAVGIFANRDFQGSNYSDELKARGLTTPEGLWKQWDLNLSIGGPILRDRLWFFSSWRDWAVNNFVADFFDPTTGRQAVYDNHLYGFTNRITAQITPRNKITVLYDRLHKEQDHLGIEAGGVSPEASQVSRTPTPVNSQVKWTSTVSNKLLIEAGYSSNLYSRSLRYQPGVARPSATNPYGDIRKVDLIQGRTWNAGAGEEHWPFIIYHLVGAVSYVTGSHSLKSGVQWGNGWATYARSAQNGFLVQQYRNGVPDSVVVYNTPTAPKNNLDIDLGVYVQDSWTMGRLTLNPGLRYDHLRGSIPEQTAGAGRFVPERHFAAVPNLPNWYDVSPRFGAAFDLFGNGKTAIKGSVGKYVQFDQTVTVTRYNPMVNATDTRTWNDLNRDDIAQDSEIGPSTNNTFGIRRNTNPDPDLKRPFSWLTNAGIQHELRPGVGVSAMYVRRDFRRLLWTDNLATTAADYTLINIPDPRGNGQTLPIYNLAVSKRGLIDELESNSDANKRIYDGIDLSLNSRFGRGGTLTLASSHGRLRTVTCEFDDPNGAASGGFVLNGTRFCDQTEYDVPFRTSFRIVGSYALPYELKFSGVFQSVPGAELPTAYSVGRAIVPTLTQPTVVVQLNEPGSQYRDRINQLECAVGREVRIRRFRILPKLELFNVLNVNPVLSDVTTFGSSLGRPQQVLPARMARINVQVNF